MKKAKVKKVKILWMILLTVLLLWAGTSVQVFAATLGGQQATGSLKVTVNNGIINIERYANGWQKQYYAPTGAVLDLNGELVGLGGYYINTPLQSTSEIVSGNGTIVTTVWNYNSSVQITQKVTLPSASAQYIYLEWTVKNTGSATINQLHLLRGHDSYLAGGDNGAGFWDANTNTIGVQKSVDGVMQRLGMQGITIPHTYESRNYSLVHAEVRNGGTLSNVIDPNELVDNGYALEWYRESLLPGDTWRIMAIESFVSSPVVAVGDSIDTNTTGEPVVLPFEVINSSSISQDVTYSVQAPEGWTVVMERTGDALEAGQRKNLNVTVTPPRGASYGTYNVVLTVSTPNASAMAMGKI